MKNYVKTWIWLLVLIAVERAVGAENLFTAEIPGRGSLLVEGRIETGQVTLRKGLTPSVTGPGEIAIAAARLTGPGGLIAEVELSRQVHVAGEPSFSGLRFLAAAGTPQYTILGLVSGASPTVLIFDHTVSPSVTRIGVFPPDVEFLQEDVVTGTLAWNPGLPNQIQMTVTSPGKSVTKTFSLITGLIIGP